MKRLGIPQILDAVEANIDKAILVKDTITIANSEGLVRIKRRRNDRNWVCLNVFLDSELVLKVEYAKFIDDWFRRFDKLVEKIQKMKEEEEKRKVNAQIKQVIDIINAPVHNTRVV